MKRMLIAGLAAAAAFCGAPAHAAQPYNWSGCYIGASAGGMWWGEATVIGLTTINGSPTRNRTEPTGFVGGGQIGCDYQAPSNWLIGIQGEFNWANARDRRTVFPPLSIDTLDTKIDWFSSATARLGYASGPWLLYGKGGAAWVRDKLHDFGTAFIFTYNLSGTPTQTGWTAGGGLEYAFAPNWSASLEYDYYDFGTKSVSLSGLGNGLPVSTRASLKQNFSVVKLGLNYRFSTSR